MAVSTMVGTPKNKTKMKNMQFGIFVFVEAQEINLRGKVVNVIEIVYFYENFFVL